MRAGGQEIALTVLEYAFRRAFADRPGQVITRDELLQLTNRDPLVPFDRSVDVRVGRLRKKVEPDPATPRYLKTVYGVGYVFDPDGV